MYWNNGVFFIVFVFVLLFVLFIVNDVTLPAACQNESSLYFFFVYLCFCLHLYLYMFLYFFAGGSNNLDRIYQFGSARRQKAVKMCHVA